MVEWKNLPSGRYFPIYEIPEGKLEEPLAIYKDRYLVDAEALSEAEKENPYRYIREILDYIDNDSSLLVFGSGHSYHCNTYFENCSKIKNLTAVDFVSEASVGLSDDIKFLSTNILEEDIEGEYDYVFTSHTLEHFKKKDLFGLVLPRLVNICRKALLVVVPYGEHWSGEPSHCCRFYENDEFSFLASRYKKIWNGAELVLWIDTR